MATASVTNTFVTDATILAAAHNTNFSDLVTFLNTSVVHRDGALAMTGPLNMGNQNITNAGTLNGRDLAADGTKLDGIAAGADETALNKALGWVTARTLALSGDASGTSSAWDGTGNATLSVTVANDSHTHDTRYYTEAEIAARQDQVYGYDSGHGGRRIFIQASQPTATGTGDIWIDT